MVNPNDPSAFRKSCKAHVAFALSRLRKLDEVQDTDVIVLLGRGNYVTHAVVTRDNRIIIDSVTPPSGHTLEDLYLNEHEIVKQEKIGDFKRDYLSKYQGGSPPQPPEPDGP